MESWNEAGFYLAWDIDCKPIEIHDFDEDDKYPYKYPGRSNLTGVKIDYINQKYIVINT